MPNDLSISREHSRAIMDAQEDFESRKQDIVDENERKLQRLRESYKKRESDIRETGDATINHIRKSTQAHVATEQAKARDRLEQESEYSAQNYENLKKRIHHQSQMLDKQVIDKREAVNRDLAGLGEQQADTVRRAQEQTRAFVQDQQRRKTNIARESAEEMKNLQESGQKRILTARHKDDEELKKINQEGQKKLRQLHENHEKDYVRVKSDQGERLEEIRKDGEGKINSGRNQFNASLNRMQAQYKKEAVKEQREGEAHLTKAQKTNQRRLEDTNRKAIETEDKLETQYQRELKRVQTEGETELKTRTDNFDHLMAEQEQHQRDEMKKTEETYRTNEKKLQERYGKRLKEQVAVQDQNLKQQKDDFQKRFAHNEALNKDSLQNQNNSYLMALYKQKQEYQRRFDITDKRADDPFYQMLDLGANLQESDNAYTLTARIPKHERDNVDVRVKEDIVILSAKRNFGDELRDENGVRTTTNSQQSFRQEFKLNIPVDSKLVLRELKDDGTLTVTIPKKGYA